MVKFKSLTAHQFKEKMAISVEQHEKDKQERLIREAIDSLIADGKLVVLENGNICLAEFRPDLCKKSKKKRVKK